MFWTIFNELPRLLVEIAVMIVDELGGELAASSRGAPSAPRRHLMLTSGIGSRVLLRLLDDFRIRALDAEEGQVRSMVARPVIRLLPSLHDLRRRSMRCWLLAAISIPLGGRLARKQKVRSSVTGLRRSSRCGCPCP
jgi:hypothetical protein